MPNRVIELMSEGCSKAEVAGHLLITEPTFIAWTKKHPDFLKAVQIGTQLSKVWWYKEGRENISNNKFNSPLYKVMLAIQFQISTDITEQRFTGSIEHTHHGESGFDPSKLSDEDLQRVIATMDDMRNKCKEE